MPCNDCAFDGRMGWNIISWVFGPILLVVWVGFVTAYAIRDENEHLRYPTFGIAAGATFLHLLQTFILLVSELKKSRLPLDAFFYLMVVGVLSGGSLWGISVGDQDAELSFAGMVITGVFLVLMASSCCFTSFFGIKSAYHHWNPPTDEEKAREPPKNTTGPRFELFGKTSHGDYVFRVVR